MADVMMTNMGKTEGKRYMISDAAKMVDVESHVLRYWEEELDIEIPRNEMGHRYYTDYYIQAFRKIKELKDQGFLLKAIKIALPEIMGEGENIDIYENVDIGQADMAKTEMVKAEISKVAEMSVVSEHMDKPSKIEQFQMILGDIVKSALEENNKTLSDEMSKNVSDSVIKEMDYLMRMKEEREEERFKKFDEMVRGLQKDNKMAAERNGEKKKKFFGRR